MTRCPSRAATLFQVSAELGNAEAARCYAAACFAGEGVPRSLPAALRWFKQALRLPPPEHTSWPAVEEWRRGIQRALADVVAAQRASNTAGRS